MRKYFHLILKVNGQREQFKAKIRGSSKRPSNVPDRAHHAQKLLKALNNLPDLNKKKLPGVYLSVSGRPGEPLISSSLNKSGLSLLNIHTGDNDVKEATIFASPKGIEKLKKKIRDFAAPITTKKDGTEGRPKNADLVQSIDRIVEAGLRDLWHSPQEKFPSGNATKLWELWISKEDSAHFIDSAPFSNVKIFSDRLEFPDDVVVIAEASSHDLAALVRTTKGIQALACPATTATADDFCDLPINEQVEWMEELQTRTTFSQIAPHTGYITLLDTGVSVSHPLIQPALQNEDRHAAQLQWSVDDILGHGTALAGLALYGDLTAALESALPLTISHRLESVKIIPDSHHNQHHLLGAITQQGINAAEIIDRRRVFCLASTTTDDTPHDGAPTSWSSEVDQLASGSSGTQHHSRLILISVGNSDQNRFTNSNYLPTCDSPENEVESPSQAWNAISVGAFTNKSVLPKNEPGRCLAEKGDLSPSSRTASWDSHWPIKPDVVYEGGNWVINGAPPPLRHEALSLLTTDFSYPEGVFTTVNDTSAATALAARDIAQLWAEYPSLWPETIRALFVSSARWTPQMKNHLPTNTSKKRDYDLLFQRYGYGVPDLQRARRSASNALTLIVEDTIIPYRTSPKHNGDHHLNEMKVFALPWPTKELRRLGNTMVTLRVALSTFIEPNPSEAARGSKFRYASHNLRFKLNRPDENRDQFSARINSLAAQTDTSSAYDDDGWIFGPQRRDVGSLHIDELSCKASDLARRNLIAVHPIAGWWKLKNSPDPTNKEVKFSLIIEIDASKVQADLYTEVKNVIKPPIKITG